MDSWIIGPGRAVWFSGAFRFVLVFAPLAWVAGCPQTPGSDPLAVVDGGAEGEPTATVDIASFKLSFQISELDPPISVIYSVTTEAADAQVSGFWVPVADASPQSAVLGDAVITHSGLAVGLRQAFTFDPGEAGVGFYRVGVIVTIGSTQFEGQSNGAIQVQGPPVPRFIRPVESVTSVFPGGEVIVSFDAGDPEGIVQWRLFYLSEANSRTEAADDLGTELKLGSGNVGAPFTFSTAGFVPGDYELGVSATDTGFSISGTVANGDQDRIVTIPRVSDEPGESVSGLIVRVLDPESAIPPTVEFQSPGAVDADVFGDQLFTVEFTVGATTQSPTALVDVFYDDDTNPDNETFPLAPPMAVAVNPPTSPTPVEVEFNTSLFPTQGAYFIGATVRDGMNAPVTRYATGQIVLVRSPAIEVSEPGEDVTIHPSIDGEDPITVTVEWTTNVAASAGLLDVYAKALDESGDPVGPELALEETGTTTADFTSLTSGLYEVFVRVIFNDESLEPLIVAAPGVIRVSSLPPVVWLGDLGGDTSVGAGVIFEGANREDNAGSSLATVGDLDGDTNDDFVIVARYGKPSSVSGPGVGPGEAYLIYGLTTRLSGTFNLNSVGTSGLKGVTFTGIPTLGNSDDTDGMTAVALIPDNDGDTLGEIAFGFPRTDSASQAGRALEASGQFLNGGVVIVSSTNAILGSPLDGLPVIELVDVGQVFSSMTVEPAAEESTLIDSWEFDAGLGACIAGTDGVNDTIVGPSIGFTSLLAPPLHEQLGFQIIEAGTAEADNVCETQYSVGSCVSPSAGNDNPFGGTIAGSGFYPASATAVDPKGARIIGRAADDGFGTSIAPVAVIGSTGGPGNVVITAPNRTATSSDYGPDTIGQTITSSGVAYVANNRTLWGRDSEFLSGQVPPTPHQYVMMDTSHCGDDRAPPVGQFGIAGAQDDKIENVIGIANFTGDTRSVFVVGAPLANGGQGAVYVAYRPGQGLEGGYVLEDAVSTDGALITTGSTGSFNRMGSSLASGIDFNRDGLPDLIIGSPDAGGGVGEIIVVFGDSTLSGSMDLRTLLLERTAEGLARAVRIKGNKLDVLGGFGFNVANAGDVDDDGLDDLLVSAPNASPRYDDKPTDDEDKFSAIGVDSSHTDLLNAGVVYVISGASRIDQIIPDETTGEISISVDELGMGVLDGYIIAGRSGGDRIGGGDAGDDTRGGNPSKRDRGRSAGLASAGDVDGDGRADILIGSVLADPRATQSSSGVLNAGEVYLIYSTVNP